MSPSAFMNIDILKDEFLLLLEESNKPYNVTIHLLYHMPGDFRLFFSKRSAKGLQVRQALFCTYAAIILGKQAQTI